MAVKNMKSGFYIHNDEEVSFNFCTSIGASDKARFVKFVTASVFDEEGYYSVLVDLMFNFAIIEVFTDIDTSRIRANNAIENIETFVNDTNIVDIVVANADEGLIDELRKSVGYSIEYRTGIYRNPISESLSNLLDTIERKVSEIDIDIDSLVGMADMLGGISGELTMDKMLDAYSKSDMYKSNMRNVVAEKKDKSNVIKVINNKKQ